MGNWSFLRPVSHDHQRRRAFGIVPPPSYGASSMIEPPSGCRLPGAALRLSYSRTRWPRRTENNAPNSSRPEAVIRAVGAAYDRPGQGRRMVVAVKGTGAAARRHLPGNPFNARPGRPGARRPGPGAPPRCSPSTISDPRQVRARRRTQRGRPRRACEPPPQQRRTRRRAPSSPSNNIPRPGACTMFWLPACNSALAPVGQPRAMTFSAWGPF